MDPINDPINVSWISPLDDSEIAAPITAPMPEKIIMRFVVTWNGANMLDCNIDKNSFLKCFRAMAI